MKNTLKEILIEIQKFNITINQINMRLTIIEDEISKEKLLQTKLSLKSKEKIHSAPLKHVMKKAANKDNVLELKKNESILIPESQNSIKNVNDIPQNLTKIKDIFGNECESLTKDHIFPIAKKGSNKEDNIIFLCKSSNLQKSSKTSNIRVNDIKFSIIQQRKNPATDNENATIDGVIQIEKDTLSIENLKFFEKNAFIKKEILITNKFFLLINNLIVNEYYSKLFIQIN